MAGYTPRIDQTVLLDTNVLVAAFVSRGLCHEVFERCIALHRLVSSEPLLRELEESLARLGFSPPGVLDVLELVHARVEVIEPVPLGSPVCRDPDDDLVLATALSARATCLLVTPDKDLLVLHPFQGIPIVSPRAFWQLEAGTVG